MEYVANGCRVPKVGMEFENSDKAYWFYTRYAREIGFNVRKHLLERSSEGIVSSRTFVCYKEGYIGDDNGERLVKKPRASERIGCFACMTIKITGDGRYQITEFQPIHNHELVPPIKAQKLKPRRMLINAQTVVSDLADAGTAPKANYAFLEPGKKLSESIEPHFLMEDVANEAGVPKVCMEFENDEKAYWFYTKYAIKNGFSVRKHWCDRSSKGVIISRMFVCYKEGHPWNHKGEHQVKEPQLSQRTGCPARMIIKITKNGRYHLSEFQPSHNHELVTPIKAHMLKSHKKLTEAQAAAADISCGSGMMTKVTNGFMSRQAGNCQLLTSLSREFQNYLPSKHKSATKLEGASAMTDTLPLLRESGENGIVLNKERKLLLKQRDSALQEAQLWRCELAKARERVVLLEASVFRAEERARALEAKSEAKLKESGEEEMNATNDKLQRDTKQAIKGELESCSGTVCTYFIDEACEPVRG